MTLFSVAEVAKVVGLSERGVRELVRGGVVKAHRISGRLAVLRLLVGKDTRRTPADDE